MKYTFIAYESNEAVITVNAKSKSEAFDLACEMITEGEVDWDCKQSEMELIRKGE